MKIATWNVNSLNVRLPHVLEWLASAEPDVLVLQEIKQVTEAFQEQAFEELSAVVAGQMKQLEALDKKLEALKEKVESPGAPGSDAPQNDPPPHY